MDTTNLSNPGGQPWWHQVIRNWSALWASARQIDTAPGCGNLKPDEAHAHRLRTVWRIYERNGVQIAPCEQVEEIERSDIKEQKMTTSVEECVYLARAELKVAKTLLTREISDYPTPIAGCDCQFNHLLAERDRVAKALATLEAEAAMNSPKALRAAV